MKLEKPLQIFAYGDLLVLYWRCEQKLTGDIELFLNDEPLPKPILGVEFKERPDYILIALAPGVEQKRPITVRITSPASALLAQASSKRPTPLPRKLIDSWSLTSRIRLEKALLVQARQVFPDLSPRVYARLAMSLAETEIAALRGPGGLLYVRMPWPASAPHGLMEAVLRLVPRVPSEAFSEPVQALVDKGCIHFFARRAYAQRGSERLWLLDAGGMRCAPFLLREPKSLEAMSLSAWLEAVAADYPENPALLRGFAATVMAAGGLGGGEEPRLLGAAEALQDGGLVGWAYHPRWPHRAVRLQVLVDGRACGEIEACLPRPDLAHKGYDHCGFVWPLEEGLLDGDPHEIRLRCVETGQELPGGPFRLGRGSYDGGLQIDEEGCLVGWVKERCSVPRPRKVKLLIDGREAGANRFDLSGLAVGTPSTGDGRFELRLPLPDSVFDTEPHTAELEIGGEEGEPWVRLDPKLTVKASYRGYVDLIRSDRVAGWIINTLAPKRPVTLDVVVNGRRLARGRADRPRSDVKAGVPCGFEIAVPPHALEWGGRTLELCLADTEVKVLGSFLDTPYDVAVRALATLAEMLNDPERWRSLAGGLQLDGDVSTWVRTQIVANLLHALRRAQQLPTQIHLTPALTIRLPERTPPDSTVDVIVPVYLGRHAVLRCITSVLCARCETPMELIVIDDASPDPELRAELRRLAAMCRFTFLENAANLGFVATVNRGMRLHPGRDVVLLNSDTVVPEGWLDRLRRAAYAAPNIGTVTPFSNNATILSFPRSCEANSIPEGQSVQRLDALFAHANAGQVVDLPTAVGFCMYIKRAVLEELGYFDEARWGKGYGEENDFCLRASALGWRHVAACDVFVEHEGGVSFADWKPEQLNHNLAKLHALYPDYARTIERFIAQDPLAPARNRVSLRLLKQHAPRYLLFVLHGLGGGTKVAADDLAARLARDGEAVLELRSEAPDRWWLECHGLPYAVRYRPEEFEALVQDLAALGVWHIHYHHTLQFPWRIWELPERLGVAYDFTAHDYLPLCPRVNMIDESGQYCGEAQFSAANCTRCVRLNGLDPHIEASYAELGRDVGRWRAAHVDVLNKARRLFAPSEDTARRLAAHFPLTNLQVQPPLEPRRILRPAAWDEHTPTVAVIGAIGPHKGLEMLLRCVQSAEKEGLPLRFAILGFTADDAAFARYGNVTISGAYQREQLPRLIAASRASVALFLSPWPETFCFALSEAWENGLYPVALDIGAVAERIRQTGCGRLLPLNADARQINRTLLEVLQQGVGAVWRTATIGWEVSDTLQDYYGLERDLAGVTRARAARSA